MLTDLRGQHVAAMTTSGVSRIAILSAALLFDENGPAFKLVRWLLRHHVRDLRTMEAVITASGLAWTIARPPRLVAGSETTYRATPDALPGNALTFRAVAAFMLDAVRSWPARCGDRRGVAMSAYALVKLAHVWVAVLGLGSITATAIVARHTRTTRHPACCGSRSGRVSVLAAMFVTGAALDVLAGGAFHEAWWFRLAALSLVPTGAMVGQARRFTRRWIAGELDADRARTRVARMAWLASALVAWITLLMELRPFQ